MHVLRRRFYLETPLGPALCWATTDDEHQEIGLWFHTWQLETKEPWSWMNPDVRIGGSQTMRRSDTHSPIHLSDERLEFLRPHILRHTLSPFYSKVTQ